MKYKGVALIIIIAVAVAALFLAPGKQSYKAIAEINKPAPPFELYDSEGKLWKLSDLKGKVVFINFWATWCVTCKAEMPDKAALSVIMKDRPFQMLGMLFRDDPKNLPAYFKKHDVTSPTLISEGNEIGKIFGITGVPETFIIDKEGILVKKFVGPKDWDSPEMVEIFEQWL